MMVHFILFWVLLNLIWFVLISSYFLNITEKWVKIFFLLHAAAAKSLQSCPTLCDPIDGSPPGSPVPGIPQAKILEWVAISFSNAWEWKVKVKLLSRARLLATPWTAAHQAPPSMGFSRQCTRSQILGFGYSSFSLLGITVSQCG